MNSTTLVGAFIGGIVLFLTGGLVYGLLLADFFTVDVSRDSVNLLYIIPGELVFGCLLAWVLSRYGVASVGDGAKNGALIGLLVALGYGLLLYGSTTIADFTYFLAEAVVWAVRYALAGAAIGWWYGIK